MKLSPFFKHFFFVKGNFVQLFSFSWGKKYLSSSNPFLFSLPLTRLSFRSLSVPTYFKTSGMSLPETEVCAWCVLQYLVFLTSSPIYCYYQKIIIDVDVSLSVFGLMLAISLLSNAPSVRHKRNQLQVSPIIIRLIPVHHGVAQRKLYYMKSSSSCSAAWTSIPSET